MIFNSKERASGRYFLQRTACEWRYLLVLYLLFGQYVYANPQVSLDYIFPLPGSHHHPEETVIILRFKNLSPFRITNLTTFINVNGDKQGQISGTTIISTDNRTIVFKPLSPYLPGERISVQTHPLVDGNRPAFADTSFQFTITSMAAICRIKSEEYQQTKARAPVLKKNNSDDPIMMNGISIPSDFPFVNITVNDNPDSGYIFLTSSWDISVHYSMILDNSGAPIWYMKTPDFRQDFKVQSDGRLTMLVDPDYYGRYFIAMDSTYTVVDTFYAPPGYYVDEHELLVRENGNYLLIAKNDSVFDMSERISGGNPYATVRGNSVVEMDADDNPIFIWRSWDHFDILDAQHINFTANLIDYVHMNAIDIDHDGHILLSCRHLSEITKINRQTGQIIWRLGGKNDYFDWINDDDRLSWQHSIRVLPNGNYMVFDNGNFRPHQYSRALIFSVDTNSWTVTKEWEYRETPDLYSSVWGNVQALPNGNILICWAYHNLPKLMEVRPDGSKAFQMDFIQPYPSYRTFRYPWKGKARVPYLMIEPASDYITLLFNKFGDENVVHYNVYGDDISHPDQIIATRTKPFIHLNDLPNKEEYFFRVTAVDAAGNESEFSNEESVFVKLIQSGQNKILNGNFSDGFNHWEWEISKGVADWAITNREELHIAIFQSSTDLSSIQVRQPNIILLQGTRYLLEFNAYADQARTIEIEVKKGEAPWTNYSKKGISLIRKEKNHYSYEFVMQAPSDPNARIEINVGNSNQDVYIDNVSLKEVPPVFSVKRKPEMHRFTLSDNYPNPFNPSTKISYTIAKPDFVLLRIYNLLGEKVNTLVNKFQSPGQYTVSFDAGNLASGIYFYELQVGDIYIKTKKMLLMR